MYVDILLFLKRKDKYILLQVGQIMLAELPATIKHQQYNAIVQFMLCGPYGVSNPRSPYMINRMHKALPKSFYNENTLAEDWIFFIEEEIEVS